MFNEVADGITILDMTGQLVFANDIAASLNGFKNAQELLQTPIKEIMNRYVIFDEVGRPFQLDDLPSRKALLGLPSSEVILRFQIKATGKEHWAAVKAIPWKNDAGETVMVVNIFRDITEQRQNEAGLELSYGYQEFLSKVSEILFSSLDYEITTQSLADLVVPDIADWCGVDMLDDQGQLKRLAVAHIDPEKVKWAKEIHKKYPTDMTAKIGLPHVIRTGVTEFYPDIPDEMLVATAKDPEHLKMLREIGLKAIIITPLKVGKKVLGALTLVRSYRSYHQSDVQFTEEIARRAALAIENSQLYSKMTESALRLQLAQRAANIGTFEWNLKTQQLIWTPELELIYGIEPGSFVGDIQLWRNAIHPEDVSQMDSDVQTAINSGQELETEFRIIRPNGDIRWVLAKATVFKDRNGKSERMIGINMDITEKREAEHLIRHQATHDPLTGLVNRKVIEERFNVARSLAMRHHNKIAVMFLDLDRFKNINDTLGHYVGDMILKEVALRFTSVLREADTVARLGGDEFMIMLTDVQNAKGVAATAQKLLNILEKPIIIDTHSLHVSTSIGIAMFSQDGEDIYTLLKNADIALYRAKEGGRNRYQFYDYSMNMQSYAKLSLENELRQTVERKEIVFHYQGIVDKEQNVIGIEALMRWQHPKLGLLYPYDFITLAEETGLIIPIGQWGMQEVLRQFKKWQDAGMGPQRIAINISTRQFAEFNLVDKIVSIVKTSGLGPENLEMEITESIAMGNTQRTNSKFKDLRNLGVSISIDDFGTGYSSLSYLKSFPVNRLKIDKSFVRHALSDEQDKSIIKAIIAMGHSLGIQIVAEGIETKEQQELLSSFGCDGFQGYSINKPIPADEFTKWLHSKQRK